MDSRVKWFLALPNPDFMKYFSQWGFKTQMKVKTPVAGNMWTDPGNI
jgi:hypothetical protein